MSQAVIAIIAATLEAADLANPVAEVKTLTAYIDHARLLYQRAGAPQIVQTGDAWKEAIVEACIASCVDWDESSAKKSLAGLIKWEVELALDPRVSERAALLQRGENYIYNFQGQLFARDPLNDKRDAEGVLWAAWKPVRADVTPNAEWRQGLPANKRPTLDELRAQNSWESSVEAPTRPRTTPGEDWARAHVRTVAPMYDRVFEFVYEPDGSAFLTPMRISVSARNKEDAMQKINSAMRRQYGHLRELTDAEAGRATGPQQGT